jgi:hypothetical protein
LVFLAAVSACTGHIGDRGGPEPGEVAQAQCSALPRRISLLTARHYGNAVRDLLGLGTAPSLTSAGGNPDALFHGGADTVSAAMAFEYHRIAEDAATEATEALETFVGCAPDLDEASCARDFIARFGARAFRRPVADDEQQKLFSVFTVGEEQDGTFRGGIQLVVRAVLQSPSFLYRTELGTASPDGTFRLTPHELITELSFFLSDSAPSAESWQAVEDGQLETTEGIEAEVDRLLADAQVRSSVTQVFLRWLGTRQVSAIQKAAPEFTPELQASIVQETELYLDGMLWSPTATLEDLFTSRTSWVNEPLAALYGIPYPGQSGDGFVEATLPADQRAGLLTQASLMTMLADVDETSVVRRGLFVFKNLLCQNVGMPPENAAEVASEIAKTETTERGRAEARMEHTVCGTCHSNFDPFGIMFEGYDAIGRHRTTADGEAIDASWDITTPPGLAGATDGAVELAERLAASPELTACTTRQLASYAVGVPLTASDQCVLDALAPDPAAGSPRPMDIIRRIATSAVFRARRDGGAQ